MKIKRLLAIILAGAFALALSGCSPLETNIENLIVPPRLEGDMRPVQEELEKSAGSGITLRYPMEGEYRSAIILKDLDGDKENEAVAFYSTTADSTVMMHINVIDKGEDGWKSKGNMSLVGSGVESVSFSDLDGDGFLDIIVGWQVYGTVEKKVGIYAFNGKTVIQRALEQYTNFTTVDMTGDGRGELTLIYLDSPNKQATAKVINFSKAGVVEIGNLPLDGGVTSYSKPIFSTLSDGTPALYVDAVKGSGMLTEVLWFDNGVFRTIYDPTQPTAAPTYREGAVASRDYNGDGVIDIPRSETLLSTAEMADTDKIYFTNWSDFDGHSFRTLSSTFMNYSDGYSLTIPAEWKDRILLIRRTEARMRIIYIYDPETGQSGNEIFRITVVTDREYAEKDYSEEGYFLMTEKNGLMYLSMVDPDNPLGITEDTVKTMFTLIA